MSRKNRIALESAVEALTAVEAVTTTEATESEPTMSLEATEAPVDTTPAVEPTTPVADAPAELTPDEVADVPALPEAAFATLSSTMAFLAAAIPPVVAAPPLFPFVGVKTVKAKLEASFDLQKAVVCLMHHLQTEAEQNKRDTETRNKAGFMSSDAHSGSLLAEILEIYANYPLTEAESAKIVKIGSKYSKQLSIQLRRIAMISDPKLAAYAATFSITN
jgi:hypothetical protein